MSTAPEVAWFSALCDDDYEFLGVADPTLASTWEHCADIVTTAERNGFDNVLLPSGYTLGIDATAFAAGIATRTRRINLLLAVRMGELWPPQLARQLASIDQMARGRLTVNIISSDLPGAPLPSGPRYQRTREYMTVLRTLLDGRPVDFDGEFVSVQLDPPRVGTVSGRCPPFYFGGFSDDAKHTAAVAADVFLTWPDTVAGVAATVNEMRERAAAEGRALKFGLRSHVVVRPTEAEAIDATRRLVSQLDDDTGAAIRARALDSASVGVRRQAELRDSADDNGFAEEGLWTGIGRARSGAGAAIVGDPDAVAAKLDAYRAVGIDAFILSGYPHLAECDLFGRLVLQTMAHRKLWNP
ncbi:LLM class flavin-dependent oxidoreductase [Candidatus Poriferisodalis sp.]|uniref:LLM class flavin-dependent oxidoreductase n=1 Tax=Candidatus Poriferisodalis sp. TaxID=3101277 RepID=UPI003B01265A